MQRFDAEQSESFTHGDIMLTASIFLLTGLGLVTLYSSSYAFGERFFSDGLFFISRQALLGAVGLALFFAASRVKLEWVRKMVKPLVFLSIVLCLLVLVPGIGVT
jgi:cell division protein FtsW